MRKDCGCFAEPMATRILDERFLAEWPVRLLPIVDVWNLLALVFCPGSRFV